jgi:F-type H+-transporting ATPase subunit b
MENILNTLSLTHFEAVGILAMTVAIYLYWRLFTSLVVNKFVALYEAREAVTSSVSDSSEKLIETANELEKEVQQSLNEARAKIAQHRIQKLEAAKEGAKKTIAEAEEYSEKLMHQAREELDNDYQIAKQQIVTSSDTLSRDLADKVKAASLLSISLISMTLLGAVDALAASGHHGQATPDGLIPYAVNFVLYVSIIFYFCRKPVKQAWTNRISDISAQVQSSQAQRLQAEQKLSVAKQRFESINTLLGTLQEESEASINSEAQAILKDARDRATRIREQGQSMVQAEKNSARRRFRKELAEAIVAKAKATLKKETSADVDKNSRMKTIESIGALIN